MPPTVHMQVNRDGEISYLPARPTQSLVRARTKQSGRLELEVRERTTWHLDRNQLEIATYVFDHAKRRFWKEWRDARTGKVTFPREEGHLENQGRHGLSGKSGYQPPRKVRRPPSDPEDVRRIMAELRTRLARRYS